MHFFLIAALNISQLNTSADVPTPWQPLADKKGVRTFKREVPGSPFPSFKGSGVFDIHVSRLMAVYCNEEMALEWIDMLQKTRILETLSPKEVILYQKFNTPWPVVNRDYIWRRRIVDTPRKRQVQIILTSIEKHPRAPVPKNTIRAVSDNVWTFKAMGKRKSYIEVTVVTDLRGSIPAWLVNRIGGKWPRNTILALLMQARKPGIKPHPDYAAW